MYNVATPGYLDIINREMQFAVLSNLCSKLCGYYGEAEITINGEEYTDDNITFYYRYNNKPETVRLIAEENKNSFLHAAADGDCKPRSWSPERYYDLLLTTYDFLCDKSVLAPCGTDKDDEIFKEKYESKGYSIKHLEYIIGTSMQEVYEDDFLKEEYQKNADIICSAKSFKKAVIEQADLFREVSESEKDYAKIAMSVNNKATEDKNNIINNGFSEKETYQYLFERIFNFDYIKDMAFYDNDYLSLIDDERKDNDEYDELE